MRTAHTNRPIGRRYNEAFAQLLRRDGLDTMDKVTVSALIWLYEPEHPERLEALREIRNEMTAGYASGLIARSQRASV